MTTQNPTPRYKMSDGSELRRSISTDLQVFPGGNMDQRRKIATRD